jgi:signal transduction histidine kinase
MTAQTDKKLNFRHLPGYCDFLLKEKLDEFVQKSFDFSREEQLPIMKLFSGVPDETLLELGRIGVVEMLSAIAENKVAEYVNVSIEKWKDNTLSGIDKNSVSTEDITNGAFVRRKIFRHFLNGYTADSDLRLLILEEADRFTTHTELLSYDAYVHIQKETLEKTNQMLSQRESQLLEAQELAEMGSFLWDMTDSSKSDYTPQLLKLFGMEKSSKLEAFLEYVHPEDRTILSTAIEKALKEKKLFECEYRYLRHGEVINIHSKGMMEYDGDKPLRMKGTVRDTTRKHRMINHVNELNKNLKIKNLELERSVKELESFSYIASHDLQEPLRKIQTFSTRLLEKNAQLPGETRDYLERINASAQRMKKLIEDLLAYSRATGPSDSVTAVDLNQVLAEALQTLSLNIEKSGAQVHAETLPTIVGVPFQLAQLVVNLISNSLKYRKENETPVIRVSTKTVNAERVPGKENDNSNYTLISFRDNGIGFENEYSEKIFELFQRLHGREQYSGTGIGLAICKKIIQNYGGAICAESEPGKGATFHVYIPADRVLTSVLQNPAS